MKDITKAYLALGDSMSIDDYTGVTGGGAANQFYRTLGAEYQLNDCTVDGCTIPQVPLQHCGEIITITIGGNDALQRIDEISSSGISGLASDHLRLLNKIRKNNPVSLIIVGDIYEPQESLPADLRKCLSALNEQIAANTSAIGGRLAGIHDHFMGREQELLCQNIEPNLAGAKVIAGLFREKYDEWIQSS